MNEKKYLRWWEGISRYQWLVLIIAWMGWVFDAMDSTLYVLVLHPSLHDLLGASAGKTSIAQYGSIILSVFLLGWALGGVLFGVLADRWGRTRTLALTILVYALFTGLAGMAQTWWQLCIFRFLTALGVGGEWAAGAALVAEVFPRRSRTQAAGILHSAWAVGFFFAAIVNLVVTQTIAPFFPGISPWRFVFAAGILPALVAAWARRSIGEPEKWRETVSRSENTGSIRELFTPALRRSTFVGAWMAAVAVLCLWSVTYWSPSFVRESQMVAGYTPDKVESVISYLMMALNAGAFIGYLSFGPVSEKIGRRMTFAVYFIGSFVLAQMTFLDRSLSSLFLLLPCLGFFNNGIFSGFAIYFPEIFPTNVRTTGCGFCFNAGRIIAALGPLLAAYLVSQFGSYSDSIRMVAFVYLLGLFAIPIARETRGIELP